MQANALSGPSLSQAPAHLYGSRLNPNPPMAVLIAQSESSQTGKALPVHTFSVSSFFLKKKKKIEKEKPARDCIFMLLFFFKKQKNHNL